MSLGSTRPLTRNQINGARGIAIIADAMQIILFPIFAEGFISPFDDALDVIVGVAMCVILGFHLAFIPAFLIEALPVADEAPTWTIAVFIATAGRTRLD